MMAIPARGTHMPHVTFTRTDGTTLRYADIWQRTQLLLILLPPSGDPHWNTYGEAVLAARNDWALRETTAVVTRHPPAARFEAPLVLVADRWGEITSAAPLETHDGVVAPDVETLIVWVDATLHRCPECEGEAL